jgi:hypothetical protein
MTKTHKTIVLICSILAFIGFGLWFYFDHSFEPAIGIIASIGGLASLGIPLPKTKYKKNRIKGNVTFDYSNNNGSYTIGKGEMLFETKWSKASDVSIHLYNDPPSIQGVAVAQDVARIKDIKDSTQYDMSSRVRTIQKSEIAILKNNFNNYAAIRVINIKDNTRGHDKDELNFEYIINPKGLSDFS